MGKSLIIVESPTKAKTLKKFLPANFEFAYTVGHIRDLPEKEFGIDIEHDFNPTYVIMPDKEQVISNLKKAAKGCDTIYLSPDPDREGEAIAWHLTQILPLKTNFKRVEFNAYTKEDVQRGLNNPREIDMALVNAQQARRLLDRIVGYKISPILNRRVQRGKEGGVSAGRVQSVALKLVVDREKEIKAFKPVEFWNISVDLEPQGQGKAFTAFLFSVGGKKVEKEGDKNVFLIPTKEVADSVLAKLKGCSYDVGHVERKEKKRYPVPPFITSTLQQEASRHFGFSSAKTMSVAQSLYEGVELGNEGTEGLITYMRTDSVRVAGEAVAAVRNFISQKFGAAYLPDEPKAYTSKKSAQDAHEAIRPTNLYHPPEFVEPYLDRDQFRLYKLIWNRFAASQMNPAIYDTVSADIIAHDCVFRATGSVVKFLGFLATYEEKIDDDEKGEKEMQLPDLQSGQKLKFLKLHSEQAFTRPPPRFTEASLVKELEKSGIGRPATYASIMNKIQSRQYTEKEKGRLKPTEVGVVIAEMLEANFHEIMDVGFTAAMEDELEHVAENRKEWKQLIRDFWDKFEPTLQAAEKSAFVPKVMTDIDCPKCSGKLQKVWFRSKYFFGCSNYPECDYTSSLEEMEFNKEDYADDFDWGQKCPVCQSDMKVRHGRFGAFLGCSKYPECKGIINIPKKGEEVVETADMPKCPALGCPGVIMSRKSWRGKTFYSCSTFPDCDVIVNNIDDLQTKYVNYERKAYVKKGKKGAVTKKGAAPKKKATTSKTKKKVTREMPSCKLSPELADVVGAKELARPEVVKQLWTYIKEKGLQDPANKRLINPDSKLAKVFGTKDPVQMFAMMKLISKHMSS